ncbi:hypothetical protein [Paenibacillus sp. SYP-B4298]|uniref:hypothetical protein n=1 Tax=Paenibacillus sp. SYP-B4298 TaxID=2996034 RepID=UPI0022DD3B6A|nr:hypothetical protein [Paenibacillus sp. SYP-B4298]
MSSDICPSCDITINWSNKINLYWFFFIVNIRATIEINSYSGTVSMETGSHDRRHAGKVQRPGAARGAKKFIEVHTMRSSKLEQEIAWL